ncbi:MAG: hypothetical protein AAF456_13395 [Planctomycetota bacterium]
MLVKRFTYDGNKWQIDTSYTIGRRESFVLAAIRWNNGSIAVRANREEIENSIAIY